MTSLGYPIPTSLADAYDSLDQGAAFVAILPGHENEVHVLHANAPVPPAIRSHDDPYVRVAVLIAGVLAMAERIERDE